MELLSLIPSGCWLWCEPFMGSAAVTLNKFTQRTEILNDRDRGLTNLFQLMAERETGRELLGRLLKLPYSESEFIRAKRAYSSGFRNVDQMRAAELYFVLITQSFNTTRQTWRKGVTQQEYTNSLKKNLPLVYKRLEGVTVTNMDALDLIRVMKYNPHALVFLDPPYCHELRGKSACSVYAYEMDNLQQIEMLELIRDATCKIILCGYRSDDGNDLYDRYLLPYGWTHLKVAELVKACQNTKNGTKDFGEEWVWINYEPPACSKYYVNMDSKDVS
jgi:DNA adenine methylase